MIDLDRMDEQLDRALTELLVDPGPVAGSGSGVRELLELGRLDEVETLIVAATNPLDAATWRTMRALLDGRRDVVSSGLDELLGVARAGDERDATDRYRVQRFWAALEWGTEAERFDVLDHCRERAYRFDDLAWWGNLILLLSTLGKTDEAVRAFDATSELLCRTTADTALRLDVVTNMIEAAALLGDGSRVAVAHRLLVCPAGRMVVVGHGVVCKGSVDRYVGLAFAAQGRWAEAARAFRSAADAHRAMGAAPLLARTLQQAERAQVAA